MQIEVKLDQNCGEPKVVIITPEMNDEINELVRRISEKHPQVISGFRDDHVEVIDPPDIVRAYCADQKVYVCTVSAEYTVRMRLYELEERLDSSVFVRISNSEIINLKKVKGFDLSFTGTICVTMNNGAVTYVSRRYVPKIRQVLGI